MDRDDLNGLFVVFDLDNEEIVGYLDTEEEARADAARLQDAINPPIERGSFAVCRLELLE